MRTLLALDLGTKTGWALRSASGDIASGMQSFQPSRFEGGGMRYLKFQRWLDEMAARGLDEIMFEEVRNHAGVTAAHVYGGFLSHLQTWAEPRQIPFSALPVGTIKKHATGKGNASKNEMVAWARMGFKAQDVKDDNQADALAILKWMIDHEAPSNPHERPTSHERDSGRVPVGPVPLARRPITNRGR